MPPNRVPRVRVCTPSSTHPPALIPLHIPRAAGGGRAAVRLRGLTAGSAAPHAPVYRQLCGQPAGEVIPQFSRLYVPYNYFYVLIVADVKVRSTRVLYCVIENVFIDPPETNEVNLSALTIIFRKANNTLEKTK